MNYPDSTTLIDTNTMHLIPTQPHSVHTVHRILRAIGTLFSVQAVTMTGGVVFQIILSRMHGAEVAGLFTKASATALLLAVIIDFGYEVTIPRSAQDGKISLPTMLREAQSIKNTLWALICLVMLLCLLAFTVLGAEMAARATLLCTALYVVWILPRSYTMTYSAALRGRLYVQPIAIIENAVTAASYLAATVLLFCDFAVVTLIAAVIMVLTLAEIVKAVLLRYSLAQRLVIESSTSFHLPLTSFGADWSFLWNILALQRIMKTLASGNITLVLMQILATAEARLGIYALGMFSTDAAVGYYIAALRFLTVLRVLPGAVLTTLLPVFSERKIKHYRSGLSKGLAIALAFGIVVGIVVYLSAESLITVVYGATFKAAIPVMRVLAWLFAAHLLTNILEAYLLAHHRETLVNAGLLVALGGSALLNLLFTPLYGEVSAAWCTLAGQMMMAGTYTVVAFAVRRGSLHGHSSHT